MEVVRTPDHRFARLSAYPYPPRSLAIDEEGELRLAYVAEGAHENRPVLLLHGPPTWSYLWRRVIPMLVAGGCRVVAPDLIGFGRSDKLARARDHRLERHLAWLTALVDALDLRQAAVVAHGAAAGLALRLVTAGTSAERFNRVVAVCPLFAGDRGPADAGEETEEEVAVSELVARGCASPLSDTARDGYGAPFPEPDHRVGLSVRPLFLADRPEDMPPIRHPVLTVAGERDELGDAEWIDRLSGVLDRRRLTIAGAGHYLPEDRGPELALALLGFLRGKP